MLGLCFWRGVACAQTRRACALSSHCLGSVRGGTPSAGTMVGFFALVQHLRCATSIYTSHPFIGTPHWCAPHMVARSLCEGEGMLGLGLG